MKTKMHLGASNSLFSNAKFLRNKSTFAEVILWSRLRNNKLGVHFRRQHPGIDFVVDFYCHELKLAIEVDGKKHLDKIVRMEDECKEASLRKEDILILRFTNEEVVKRTEDVVKYIQNAMHLLQGISGKETEIFYEWKKGPL